jgi:hypothetical protein
LSFGQEGHAMEHWTVETPTTLDFDGVAALGSG